MTKKLRRILRSFKIDEISGVDFPAQKDARVVLLKRDSSRDEPADVAQKYGVRGMVDFKKMMPNEDSVALQKLIDDGELKLSKAEIHEVIEKRAEQLRDDGETLQQSYVKFITADPAGRVLFKAFQSAPIGKAKVERDAPQDDVPRHDGPASKKLHELALVRQKATGRSYQGAFTDVLTDPENRKLRDAANGERELALVRTLTIQEAQALTPTKPFSREARGN